MSSSEPPKNGETPVGYKTPPKHSQFKKGQSGNPAGRRKAPPIHMLLQELLNEPVTVNTGGTKKQVSKKEAVLIRVINDAINGKPNAIRDIVYLLKNLTHIPPY